MDLINWIKGWVAFLKPVKTIFGFYIILYLIPTSLLSYFALNCWKKLFLENGNINYGACIIFIALILSIIIWTIFYLIYFTHHRTKNPRLYGKGFVNGFIQPVTKTSKSK